MPQICRLHNRGYKRAPPVHNTQHRRSEMAGSEALLASQINGGGAVAGSRTRAQAAVLDVAPTRAICHPILGVPADERNIFRVSCRRLPATTDAVDSDTTTTHITADSTLRHLLDGATPPTATTSTATAVISIAQFCSTNALLDSDIEKMACATSGGKRDLGTTMHADDSTCNFIADHPAVTDAADAQHTLGEVHAIGYDDCDVDTGNDDAGKKCGRGY